MAKTKRNRRAVVVGGGLSGLATAWLIQEDAAAAGIPLEVVLCEAGDRPGGKIGTISDGGFVCEIGPNGFLDSKPFALQLVERMGMSQSLLRSNDSARKRFIFTGGRLQQLPEDPMAFLQSEMISIRGKLRIAAEYLVPQKKKAGADETLADFVRRRLGHEALDKLIDPMASGIFAGNPENMSLAACFPKIVYLEETYGGLLKGMLGLRKAAAARGQSGPATAGPGGALMSFNRGLAELIDGLASRLKTPPLIGAEVTTVAADGRGYRVSFADGRQPISADALVLAVPAYDAAGVLSAIDPPLAASIGAIDYTTMGVVHLGYPKSSLPKPLDGFGFLIPHNEGRRILGNLWASCIFDGRAPEGHVLLTVMMGGAQDPATPLRPEEELVAIAREELQVMLGISAQPVFSRVIRWPKAIPQYHLGHLDRVTSYERRIAEHRGLFLTGNAFRGVSMHDCVAAGMQISGAVLGYLRSAPATP